MRIVSKECKVRKRFCLAIDVLLDHNIIYYLQQTLSKVCRRRTTASALRSAKRRRPDRAWAEPNEVAWLRRSQVLLAKAKSHPLGVLRFAERLRWPASGRPFGARPSAIRVDPLGSQTSLRSALRNDCVGRPLWGLRSQLSLNDIWPVVLFLLCCLHLNSIQ